MTDIKQVARLVPEHMVAVAARVFAASLIATGTGTTPEERRMIAEEDVEAFLDKLKQLSPSART